MARLVLTFTRCRKFQESWNAAGGSLSRQITRSRKIITDRLNESFRDANELGCFFWLHWVDPLIIVLVARVE